MSQYHVNAISGRLSLRPPQKESLRLLHRVCELVRFEKDTNLAEALQTIKAEFPHVEDFEREFPSLCFALATGVGKTRLMGAFITYLYRVEGIKNFFVLAPNLTIYNKLIADFTPNTPKYVFQGIAEFATDPPEIVTGDNYESGRGVRQEVMAQRGILPFSDVGNVIINIFNISKINSEVRGGSAPRIKRLSEYIGESYFEYLSKLNDLVLVMDESHRYRASAGFKAINELKPILGLELTATPQIMQGQKIIPFKNVIYSYPLSEALKDGFVKEPAVATRENFNKDNYTEESLERLKLEDGIHIHEETRVQLDVYARERGVKTVKPFMLVVAKDTEHASKLRAIIEANDFFYGQYKGKVAEVHSNQRGEEKDENVQRLLAIEDPADPTEIVIHVDKLKEGWDVTNLYTIVPLKAFNSRNLIEQAIGRGLRLPYGKRVNVHAVDRLTIVSHDKFQEIIDEANKGDSIIRTGVVIGRDIPEKHSKAVEVLPELEKKLIGGFTPGSVLTEEKPLFDTEADRKVAKATLDAITRFEKLPSSKNLQSEDVQNKIIEQVREVIWADTPLLPDTDKDEDAKVKEIVAEVTKQFLEMTIDIPKIVVVPTDDVTFGYKDFDLDCSNVRLQPVSQEILIHYLHKHERQRLQSQTGGVPEKHIEDYLVRELIDFDDICYDDHAELLYKLARQMVEHLQSYLATEEDVLNVVQYHHKELVKSIHLQMLDHYVETASSYEVKLTKSFHTLRANHYTAAADEEIKFYRDVVDEKKLIRGMLFGGFKKCLYDTQKFDSDTERRFTIILENDDQVKKWFKPAKGIFQIYYRVGIDEGGYEPDFVVETENARYLCEPKRSDELTDPIVLAKANAAAEWCHHASTVSDKPWSYLLVPHDAVDESKTFAGLMATFTF